MHFVNNESEQYQDDVPLGEWEESLDLFNIIDDPPLEKPSCPCCGSAKGLILYGIRDLTFSLKGPSLSHRKVLRCLGCRKFLEADSTEPDLAGLKVVASSSEGDFLVKAKEMLDGAESMEALGLPSAVL